MDQRTSVFTLHTPAKKAPTIQGRQDRLDSLVTAVWKSTKDAQKTTGR
jgi:hypothetical protein